MTNVDSRRDRERARGGTILPAVRGGQRAAAEVLREVRGAVVGTVLPLRPGVAAGENFCGACGANLADAAAEQLERAGDDFRAVAEMRSACRFDEAIALLTPLAQNDHPRLAERAQRAGQLIRQLAAERERGRIVADEALQRAGQSFDAFDYDGAARILEQVPPPVRNGELEELRALIASRCEEVAALDGELREAVREKRLLDLPALVERLLAIKPDHAFARPLAEQVRKQLVNAAEKQLSAHRYDEALRVLEEIAPHLRSPQSQELYRRAAELAWLVGDLRHAPVVDATLAAIAGRLRKLAPDNARAAKLGDEVERRLRLAQAPGRTVPVAWAPAPPETPLGAAVDGLGGFHRLICAESLLGESDVRRFPGRFAIACGLALAGLKQAAVRINLLAAEQRGVLSRAARLVRPRGTRAAWALDLGPSGLKAVKLGWDDAKQQARIEAAALVEHAKPLGHAANEAEEHKLVAETIKTFLAGHETKTDRVCVGLPGRMALGRQFDLPPVEAAKAPGSSRSRPSSNSPSRSSNWFGTTNFSAIRQPIQPARRSRPTTSGAGRCWSGRRRTRRGGSWRPFAGWGFTSTCCKRILSPCTTS